MAAACRRGSPSNSGGEDEVVGNDEVDDEVLSGDVVVDDEIMDVENVVTSVGGMLEVVTAWGVEEAVSVIVVSAVIVVPGSVTVVSTVVTVTEVDTSKFETVVAIVRNMEVGVVLVTIIR